MSRRPVFENRPGTDLPGLQSAVRRYIQDLDRYLDEQLAALEAEIGAGGAPSGAAGGQLGGTYPNPDVRGLREASGPTLLNMGSVADGQTLFRNGTTIDGYTPAKVSWAYFRRRDTGGAVVEARGAGSGGDDPTDYATTVFYPAGVEQIGTVKIVNHAMTGLLGGTLADSLLAVPQVLPAGSLIRLALSKGDGGSVGASPAVRLGVYTNKGGSGNNNLYPDQLLYDTGSLTFSTTGLKGGTATSVALSGGLYWFVATCNSDAATANTDVVPAQRLYPILGMTLKCGALEPRYNDSAGIGHRHAQSFGALPSTFPSSAPRRMTAVNNGESNSTTMVPCIYYGFDPS